MKTSSNRLIIGPFQEIGLLNLMVRDVTVPLILFPVRFGSVFQQKPRFRFCSVFSYLPFLGILNRESMNAVNGNINLGYTYISKLLW